MGIDTQGQVGIKGLSGKKLDQPEINLTTMGLFTISCKKATYLVSKKEEGKLNWIESIQLRSHMAICSLCRLFEKQTQKITNLVKNIDYNEPLKEDIKQGIIEKMSNIK